jgi:hypothetical protein
VESLKSITKHKYYLAAKKVVTNQYFPAGAVLFGVVLFWTLGLLGGLSLLSRSQTLVTTLGWMLFVYTAAVLSPLAGVVAAVDLARRWQRNRRSDAGRNSGQASA